MHNLTGVSVPKTTLAEASKVADLIYFEGPLLSLFRNKLSENFLFYWCDSDEVHNRWLVIKVTDAVLERYLDQNLPFAEIIRNPKDQFLYVVDINASGEHDKVLIFSPANLPPDYIPDEDSYYTDQPIRVNGGPREERIPIDGAWGFEDLARFPNLYSTIYSFVYLTQPAGADAADFEQFPLRDGFSSVHFFNALPYAIPAEDRSELKALRYASPGAIVFKLNPLIADIVKRIYNHFKDAGENMKNAYSSTHKLLKESGYLGADVTAVNFDGAVDEYFQRLGRSFALEIGNIDYDTLLARSSNSLMALKVLMAFYRRLARLFEYEEQGKMRLPIIG